MKKLLFFLLLLGTSFSVAAQAESETSGLFTIEGQVMNAKQNFWEFVITSFFDNQRISLPLSTEGKFSQTVTINHPQNIYLYLNNDAITIFAVPGDTLQLHWDDQNFANTFRISSPDSGRQKELDLMLELYHQFRQPFLKLSELVYSDTIPDPVIYKKTEEQFASRVNKIINYPATKNSEKIIWDTYFNYARMLLLRNLMLRRDLSLELKIQNIVPDSLLSYYGTPTSNQLNEFAFYSSPPYRDFLFDRVGSSNLFNFLISMGNAKHDIGRTTQECYTGMGALTISSIREWYLTNTIIRGF